MVRIRRNVQKFYQIKTQLQAVSLHMQTLSSSHQMAEAMKGVSKAMSSMNKQMNPSQIQKIMMDFEKESEVMDMKDDMMSDAIDDAMEEGDEDQVLSNVLDEIGVSFNQEVRNTCLKRKKKKITCMWYSLVRYLQELNKYQYQQRKKWNAMLLYKQDGIIEKENNFIVLQKPIPKHSYHNLQ